MKSFLFKYYFVIAFFACLAIIGLGLSLPDILRPSLIITILGGIISSIYLVQKQKLEELKLFKDLFTEFNHRYDQMNEDLNRIIKVSPDDELTDTEINQLYDFFNLCGEEYLYYKQGFILPEVWNSWKNGMTIFYRNSRIRSLWENELETHSYYGFNFEDAKK